MSDARIQVGSFDETYRHDENQFRRLVPNWRVRAGRLGDGFANAIPRGEVTVTFTKTVGDDVKLWPVTFSAHEAVELANHLRAAAHSTSEGNLAEER